MGKSRTKKQTSKRKQTKVKSRTNSKVKSKSNSKSSSKSKSNNNKQKQKGGSIYGESEFVSSTKMKPFPPPPKELGECTIL